MPSTQQKDQWPSPARAYWGLFVLTLALVAATIDRSIIALLVEPIKADLSLSDTQFSFLTGFAFVFFYAMLGLPIARVADVKSRRAIIAAGVAFWSLATAACGLAQNFWQLFAARVGVGAGESAYAAAKYSILTDSFPPQKLPRAMALNYLGIYSGNGLANLAGGAMIAAIGAVGVIAFPLIGELRPWQLVFIIVGLPGLIVSALLMTIHEPVRKGRISKDDGKAYPIGKIFDYLWLERATYLPIVGAMAVKTLLSFGASMWLPALFMRNWDWSASQIAYWLGIIGITVTPAGIFLGSFLSERLVKAGRQDAYMRVVLWATAGSAPLAIVYPLVGDPYIALVLVACNMFFAGIGLAPGNAGLQVVTPAEMRGQVRALYQFIFNVVGYAMGPLFVALFTDYLFGSEDQLRYSMSLLAALLGPAAVVITWMGVKPFGRSFEAAMRRFNDSGTDPATVEPDSAAALSEARPQRS